HQRIALLAPRTRYGEAVADELAAAAPVAGLALTRVRYSAADASDAADIVRDLADYDRRAQALKTEMQALEGRDDDISRRTLARLERLDTLGDVPFDALLLPDGGARLRQVVPLLPYYDIDPAKVRLLGTGLWEDRETLREPTLVGGWYAGPEPIARRDFEQRYADVFGEPPGAIATLAYDATALAAALARAGVGFGPTAINDRRGFLGVDGIFRFDFDGMAERGLAVFEIKGRGATDVVSPAPDRFDLATEDVIDGAGLDE
ncbi:MAG: ABC transporter substrate-binding protein, partial [Sphingomonadales bacterium]|nr:ABC transporter substrate-binding protein [Sphingomonadales bacterium]